MPGPAIKVHAFNAKFCTRFHPPFIEIFFAERRFSFATVFAFDVGDNDWILRFEDVPNGDYYLVIFRNNTEQDRTGSFSITGKQERCYEIDDDGDLQGC